jgi:hypothetical protein
MDQRERTLLPKCTGTTGEGEGGWPPMVNAAKKAVRARCPANFSHLWILALDPVYMAGQDTVEWPQD